MCPSKYNRFSDTVRYLWKKSAFYHTPLAFDVPVRGVPVGISAPRLVRKKPEWCGYPMLKKFRRYVYSFWRDPRTRQTDGQTDGRTLHDSIDRACIASRGKNVVKMAIFGLTHWIKHRITRKLFKIDRYMLRGVWQALNCLSIRAKYCVIIAGASPGKENVGCGT